MATGDYEQMNQVVLALYESYLQNGGQNYAPAVDDSQPDQQFIDNIMDEFGADNYANLMEWSKNNLTPEQISHYDQVMESGSRQEIIESVNALYNYQQSFN